MSKPPRGTRADGELTRTRILEAAGPLFAATGYAETTSKAIAEQAGVDLASINYHFGSRSGLYLAVLTEAHGRVIQLEALQALADSDLPASAKVMRVIDALIDTALHDGVWHARILARELLSPSSHLKALLDAEGQPKFAVIRRILSEATGLPQNDPALLRCMVSIAAPCLMLLVAGNGMPGPAQEVRRMPKADIATHMHQFALAGLEAIGRAHAPPKKSAPPPTRRRRR